MAAAAAAARGATAARGASASGAARGAGRARKAPAGTFALDDLPPAMREKALAKAKAEGIDVHELTGASAAAARDKAEEAQRARLAREQARDDAEAQADREKPAKGPAGAPGRPPISARQARRSARRARRTARRGVAAVAPSAGRSLIGAGDVFLGTVVVAVFYLVVQNADTTAGALGGLAKALDWLRDSSKSIPYKE